MNHHCKFLSREALLPSIATAPRVVHVLSSMFDGLLAEAQQGSNNYLTTLQQAIERTS